MTVNDLRTALREVMENYELSQMDIERTWGVAQSAISRFLSGKSPSAEHALRILECVLLLQATGNKREH